MDNACQDSSGQDTAGLSKLTSKIAEEFQNRFGRPATLFAAAPGRVNLIGEHIDYNDGFVLPMAIERYVVIAADAKPDASAKSATVYSTDLDETVEIPVEKSSGPTLDSWGKYLEGVIAGVSHRDISIPGFDAVVASNVPHGGGLSSSAALEVATATMLEALTGTSLNQLDKALICQKAEHDYAGVPCGIMDQYSSVFGQAGQMMLIDCQSETCTMVPFDAPDISLLITNSNVKHELTGGEYASRRADCDNSLAKIGKSSWREISMDDVIASGDKLTELESLRSRHVVTEIARTMAATDALRNSEWATLGKLMYESHDSLRDDFDVSCRELDVLVEIAQEIGNDGGVIGSRMTGGGFGGCTVTLVYNDHLDQVIETLSTAYQERTGLECSCFSSRPALGAHVLDVV